MKLLKKALLYDIANLAFLIADNGDPLNHSLHQVRDICQEGNIDRVSRILGLAYSRIIDTLSPILSRNHINIDKDLSVVPHDYVINFRSGARLRYKLTDERKLRIKETAHEYMVAMVLADWLALTYPPAYDVWKYRADAAMQALTDAVADISTSVSCALSRRLSPF